MKEILKSILVLAALVSLVSCGAYKRLGYIQDMETDLAYSMPQQPDAVISKGDILNIAVTCTNPELAAPFNVTNGVYNPGGQGDGVVVSTGNSNTKMSGFEVDKDGNIIYPILGKLYVEGMTLNELSDVIEREIVDRKLIKEPIVHTSFANFKITVLGESKSGVYNVPDGKIDIFGALAMSGDLTDDAVHNDVWIVRTREGSRQLYRIDLTSKDCYYSPAFFLQQNDMVYAKPRPGKMDATQSAFWTKLGTVVTTVVTSINIYYLVNNITRR